MPGSVVGGPPPAVVDPGDTSVCRGEWPIHQHSPRGLAARNGPARSVCLRGLPRATGSPRMAVAVCGAPQQPHPVACSSPVRMHACDDNLVAGPDRAGTRCCADMALLPPFWSCCASPCESCFRGRPEGAGASARSIVRVGRPGPRKRQSTCSDVVYITPSGRNPSQKTNPQWVCGRKQAANGKAGRLPYGLRGAGVVAFVRGTRMCRQHGPPRQAHGRVRSMALVTPRVLTTTPGWACSAPPRERGGGEADRLHAWASAPLCELSPATLATMARVRRASGMRGLCSRERGFAV